jgi:hypothetical protein
MIRSKDYVFKSANCEARRLFEKAHKAGISGTNRHACLLKVSEAVGEGWFETIMRHTFTMKRSLTCWNKIYLHQED